MNYSDVKGPNTLSDFLIEGLSDETLLRIYKEKKDVMFICDDACDDPIRLLSSHVQNLFYTAGYNMISNMRVDSHIDESLEDTLINQ